MLDSDFKLELGLKKTWIFKNVEKLILFQRQKIIIMKLKMK